MQGRMKYYRNYENKWWWVVRDCTVKLGTGVKAETFYVDKLRIVGFPTADVLNGKKGKKGGTSEPAGRKTNRETTQGIKQKIKQEIE